MVPLAVYGLDFPKIPALLVDFRALFNPKRRELSRRAIDDVGRYILDASPFGDLKLYVARKVYAMVTGRKGIDVNQPSRALTYAQLKSLLVLRDELDPELRDLVLRDLGTVAVNPLENDFAAEREAAAAQHRALVAALESGASSPARSTAASSATARESARASRTGPSRAASSPRRRSPRSGGLPTATTRPRSASATLRTARSTTTRRCSPRSPVPRGRSR
jgi:hypothetical protein